MNKPSESKHRNDIYGDIKATPDNPNPPIPAATVVLLRDADSGVEVLMLLRTSKVHFGGMWVFPGGRLEEDDFPADGDIDMAARNAAVRETKEEAGIEITSDEFVWFAHWTPPPSTPTRYATWFFVTAASGEQAINVDGHEIQDHAWIGPADALAKHAAGEIDLAPPTWVTLYHLSRHSPVAEALQHFRSRQARFYETHVSQRQDGVRVAMWAGDAGYEETDADARGERHRLVMSQDGFEFESSTEEY
tara:strand:+ start:2989 stop:3732 length:744 start_codon:yes stop_codon:yes gene_type:complete